MVDAKMEKDAPMPQVLPEEFVESLHPVLKWIVENIKALAVGLGVALVLLAAYGIYDHFQNKASKESANDLAAIVAQNEGAQKVAALDAFVQKAPSNLKVSALFELVEALQAAKEYKRAAEVWSQIAAQTDKNMAAVATFGRAQSLSLAGDHAQGLALLEDLKAKAGKPFDNAITQRIAIFAELAGDLAKSVAAYKELLDQEKNQGQARGFYEYKIADLNKRAAKKK